MPGAPLPLAPVTADSRVDDALLRLPLAPAVFARHGLDGCCSGALSLRAAAERAGLPLEELLRELEVAA